MTCSDPTRTVPVADTVVPDGRPGAIPTALALATGTAVLVSAEFVPAGVLPLLADDLHVTEGRAGLAVAATALAGAITAPTIASVLPRADRRRVLLGLLMLALVSNLVVALAPSLPVLLAGRVLLGVAIAGFWSFTFGVGVAVTERPALVSTAMSLGTSVATIIGVPLASVLGDVIGWRAVFALLIAATAASGLVLARLLPPVPAHPGAGAAMMRQALGNRRLIAGVAMIALAAFANFAAYPYIRVALQAVTPSLVTVLLLAWGIGGLVGNLVGGWLSTRLRIGVVAAPAVLFVGLVLMAAHPSTVVVALAVLAWGTGFNMVPVTTQLWVSRAEPNRVEAAVSLQVTAFQAAITLGAVLGGLIVDHRDVWAAMAVGAGLAGLAAVGFAAVRLVPRED
ncbi:MFS transporter [Flexivirga endophytica]|uniref:MFS transporter n=1 Tax=Flexivirga endophytica TaxID=1849103 RepID=A0A916WW82_9MICO|nr:MFS transporter [Flexivirga endophytica]GGB38893.1 MFS transporter [Flexivirga endophytica]GHB46882.1 MFS transporter [Flexivirga endophytica]